MYVNVLDSNEKETKNAQCLTLFNNNYIDIFYIFKRKGKYKTQIFADYKSNGDSKYLTTYILQCEEDWKTSANNQFGLPQIYNNDITIIEPILNNMKKGKKVTLKMKSDLFDEITISNRDYITVKKNEDGIFEKTITVNTNNVMVGILKDGIFTTYISYI